MASNDYIAIKQLVRLNAPTHDILCLDPANQKKAAHQRGRTVQ